MTRSRALLIGLVLELAAIGISAWAYHSLPDRVPTHWDIAGNPNAYSSRIVASVLTPAIIGVMWLFMAVLPAVSPRGFRLDDSAAVFYVAMLAVIAFSLAMHVVLIRAALTDGRASTALLFAAIGTLLAIVGALLGKRLAGRLFVAGGITIVLASFAGRLAIAVLIAVVCAVAAFSIVYSYVEYRRIEGFE